MATRTEQFAEVLSQYGICSNHSDSINISLRLATFKKLIDDKIIFKGRCQSKFNRFSAVSYVAGVYIAQILHFRCVS